MASAPAPALAFSHVTKRFPAPAGGRYTAIDEVSFQVGASRFVSLVGPSGCGKSTVLNLAAGLTAPSSGGVEVFGVPLAGLNRRAGYMFQQDALLPWKTVLDNVRLGPLLRGRARDEVEAAARHWLARVGLGGFADHYPHQLSGGMRKRVAMAQHWIANPDILLMDEPFSALDIHTRQRMEGELLALWAESPTTVLFVTHDLEEAIALSDEVLVLSAGPGARVVGRHAVDLPRPRDLIDIRTDGRFIEIYRTIWQDLRGEVLQSYERGA
ncbi:MAG: ABC transporter ATP-binding protein [Vicinamibacterales bacterium]